MTSFTILFLISWLNISCYALINKNNKLLSFKRVTHVCKCIQSSHAIVSHNEIKKAYEVDLLFDSECPICMMEVQFLQKRDVNGKIRFTDLNSEDYRPEEHGNVQFETGMRKLRAVLPDNSVITGVEVFRKT